LIPFLIFLLNKDVPQCYYGNNVKPFCLFKCFDVDTTFYSRQKPRGLKEGFKTGFKTGLKTGLKTGSKISGLKNFRVHKIVDNQRNVPPVSRILS